MHSTIATAAVHKSDSAPLFEGEVLEQEYEAIHGRLPDANLDGGAAQRHGRRRLHSADVFGGKAIIALLQVRR